MWLNRFFLDVSEHFSKDQKENIKALQNINPRDLEIKIDAVIFQLPHFRNCLHSFQLKCISVSRHSDRFNTEGRAFDNGK